MQWIKTTISKNYEVSNTGEVRSLDRVIYRSDGKMQKLKGVHLKKGKWTGGYFKVCITANGVRKDYSIHRLVALAWIDNPYGLPQVNHKDGNKLNNNVNNLEWCTQAQNNLHAYQTGIKKHHRCWNGKTGYSHNKSKEVIEYDLNGVELNRYGSVREASRLIGVKQHWIQRICSGTMQGDYLGKMYKYA